MQSKQTLIWIVVFAITLHRFTADLCAQDSTDHSSDPIDRSISTLIAEHGIPGLSICVANDNQIVYTKGYGLADIEHSVPATTETRYRTASVAKPMTAAVVMSLVEQGLIDLDAEARSYCAGYPAKRWPVTVRQLLGHLGGVRHYKSKSEATSTKHFFTLRSALETFAADPLRHQPGTRFSYTSFGYNLLGSVAEGASGESFMELLQEKVFAPAGMLQTVQDNQFSLISGRASGYIRPTKLLLATLPAEHDLVVGELYNAPLHDTSMKIPGGGLLSTASDLVRFGIAINTGKLLHDDTRSQSWTSQTTDDGKETGYGFGWKIGKRFDQKTVWHTGGQSGTSTVLLVVPETGTMVAIMCNLQHVGLINTAFAIAETFQPPKPPTEFAPAIEKLKLAIDHEVEQKQLPAFSISLVDQDRVVWSDGFGFQDAEQKVAANAETVYRVGSVSKLFTDIAVLQMVDEGKLDLDAPVQSYLSSFHPRNSFNIPITLRQLMSHRSGLVRESPVGNYFDPEEPTLEQTVASLNETSLVYKPETKTKYSNAAIAVVGAVLENQLEVSHPEQIRKTILDPLGMNNSSFVVTPTVEPMLATGWMRTYDGRRFEAPSFLLGTGPAGNLYSSVIDLSKFLVCLFNDGKAENMQVISPAMLNLMTTPIEDANGKPQNFGLGFHIQDLDGQTKIGHGGAVYGFSTQLEALPERQLGVVAASSLDGSNGVVARISDYALRLMLAAQEGKTLPAYRMTTLIPPARAAELVGMYREVEGKRFTRISELGGDVFMQRGSYRLQLKANVDDGSIVTDDAIGIGTKVRLEDRDHLVVDDTSYERLADEPPGDIRASWKGLIGEYGWDHNALYILEEDGQLYALIEWFYYYPLKEVGENSFKFPDYGLYHGEGLEFNRSADGIATDVVAAEVKFVRRKVGVQDGETFKITPVKPIDDLRKEALAGSPPSESGQYRTAELVDLVSIDPTIKLDIRYATENNFIGAVFYSQPRAFMQRPAAEAVVRANARLKTVGLGLLIHDAYRPWYVTKMFWDATPGDLKQFVANPANGSRHNRGCAVDLTLYDLASETAIQMVAGYDEFSSRSFPLYPGGTSKQRWYRQLLRRTMEAEGFTIYEYEWWHFDFKDWKKYRIGNVSFEDISEESESQ